MLSRFGGNSPQQTQDDSNVFLSYKIKVNSGSVRNKTITNFQKKLYTEIKRLRKEGLSYNDISKYLNKVGWKTSRGNKFYGTNVWTFEKRIDRVVQLIDSKDSVISDLKIILGCKSVNCFFTNRELTNNNSSIIDTKIANSYFRDGKKTYLNQNPKGILIFFPNQSRTIKSYILLKVEVNQGSLIIAMGSNSATKFTPDQKVDLIEYLNKIIEIKVKNFG